MNAQTGSMAPLYDVEAALHELARARRRHRDRPDVTEALKLGRNLAEHVKRHFGPEAWETAGMALLIGGASLGAIPAQLRLGGVADSLAVMMVNIEAFAGEQLIRDARALDDADRTTP